MTDYVDEHARPLPTPTPTPATCEVATLALCGETASGRGKLKKRLKALCSLPALRPDAATRASAGEPLNCLSALGRKSERERKVKKMLVVANGAKVRSTKKGKEDVERVKREAKRAGVEVVLVETDAPGHAIDIVRSADLTSVDAVGVIGGDGTFRECVQGWIERGEDASKGDATPILAFPCGTGNNYARDLGVFTVEDAMEKVKRGKCRAMDAVEVAHGDDMATKTISINVVTWGMARDAAETAEKMRWAGPLRYDFAGLWHIIQNKTNRGTLGVSGEASGKMDENTEDYLMMFAQTTRCSGRAFTFAPLAQLDDGEFDVVVCAKNGPLHTKGLFDATKNGGAHVEDPAVAYVKAKRLSLKTETPERVGIDGEVTVSTPINLSTLPGAFVTFV